MRPADSRTPITRAIALTWLVTAIWDFLCASTLGVSAYGSTFSRVWQGVAAAALGPNAMQMGGRGVAAGLGLHVTVALLWSATFVLAVTGVPALRRAIGRPGGAIVVACIYGPIIWLVMSFIVIPLSTRAFPALSFRWWVQMVAHVPFVTLPLVFTARRALGIGAFNKSVRV